MLSLFRTNKPQVVILFFFTALALWIPYYIDPEPYLGSLVFMPQPIDIMSIIMTWNSYMIISMSLVLWLLLALMVSYINLHNQLISQRNYLPSFFFFLILAWIPDIRLNINSVIALFFILLAVHRIFLSYNSKTGISAFFETGMLISLAGFFYTAFLVFMIILWIAIVIFQRSGFRNFLISVLGIIAPWWIYFGLYYFIKGSVTELINIIGLSLFRNNASREIYTVEWILTAISLVVLIIASVYYINKVSQLKIREKRFFTIFLWIFIIILGGYYIFPVHEDWILLGLLLPVSFQFARFFSMIRESWKGNLIFAVFFFSMLLAQYLFVLGLYV